LRAGENCLQSGKRLTQLKIIRKLCVNIAQLLSATKMERVRLHLIKCPKYANSIQMLDDEDIESGNFLKHEKDFELWCI